MFKPFIYALTQFGLVQHPFGLHSGLHVCSVRGLLFLCFFGLSILANAPVATEQTNASISIFFITLFYN